VLVSGVSNTINVVNSRVIRRSFKGISKGVILLIISSRAYRYKPAFLYVDIIFLRVKDFNTIATSKKDSYTINKILILYNV
jgi:hypothetical protein